MKHYKTKLFISYDIVNEAGVFQNKVGYSIVTVSGYDIIPLKDVAKYLTDAEVGEKEKAVIKSISVYRDETTLLMKLMNFFR